MPATEPEAPTISRAPGTSVCRAGGAVEGDEAAILISTGMSEVDEISSVAGSVERRSAATFSSVTAS
jgi:hypothetical protein